MRVALISDLHANEASLDAVLADIDAAGADQLVCLGDVATLGPRPREVIEGRPSLGEGAEYAVVEVVAGRVSVDLRRVPVDKELLRGAVRGSSLPLAKMLLDEYA